ncbi:ribbon-helix-helix domain-containing protein [Sphingomonas canadensis]|uniref:Ribbon-helix-helix domain-containing protein n=1 Tax=Sphingomonas canadensis TaxID=1219257 RepID=A0ABW3H834_9SPHN|nr:ribbon-helix-helix domain-containing protein [Sphingomonas canadensis]MCW3837480.1 ribbon-helix-helix domain-containing protein [Sphingomonas canadensis]
MTIGPPSGGFHGPVKRSVTIAGHPTSISLEPLFWQALEEAAAARGLPLSALVAAIDHARIQAHDPPNLASALRSWLMDQAGKSNREIENHSH